MKNLLDLIHAPMKRIAANSGGEYAGACPFCGGEDRFRVWPEHPSGAKGGRFWCRGCGRQGDGIQFLRDVEGMGYPEACRALGLDVPRRDSRLSRLSRQAARPRKWEPKAATMPSAKWSEAAGNFLGIGMVALDRCQDGQAYVASRGILPATVAALALGWNEADLYWPRELWGLPPEVSEKTGKPRKVWLPRGLVIPSFDATGRVWALKIRRSAWMPEDPLPKYVAVAGSGQAPYVLPGKGKPVVVMESELDAVLVAQEAGSLVAAVALRSAGNKPDAVTLAVLKAAPLILVSLDRDDAGMQAAPWWLTNFRQAKRWPVVAGCKDPGDMIRRPGLIRAWIEAGMGVGHGK